MKRNLDGTWLALGAVTLVGAVGMARRGSPAVHPRGGLDYGTTVAERRKREYVVYAKGAKAAEASAKKSHPGMGITDLLLVRTDHRNVDEYVYNTVAPIG